MAALRINLADDLQVRLKARAKEAGFGTVEQYIEAMVAAEMAKSLEPDKYWGEFEANGPRGLAALLKALNWPFAGFHAALVADVKRAPTSFAILRERLVRGPASKMVEVSVAVRKAASLCAKGRAHARGCVLYAQTSVQAISAMQRAA